MKNLDTSLSNQSILDESFSNFTADDVNSLRQQLQVATDRLNALKNQNKSNVSNISSYIMQLDAAKRTVVELQKKLDSIPKSIIDAVDKINQSSSQLALEEKNKQQAAELLALENKNKEIQAAIDKAKGVSSILDDKLKGNTSNAPVAQENKMEEPKSNLFTTKNIIIGVSALVVLVGGFFLVKKIIKK